MTDPTTGEVPVSEVHDGPDEGPLETELPEPDVGAAVVLRPERTVTATHTLPAGTRVMYEGRWDEGDNRHLARVRVLVPGWIAVPFRDLAPLPDEHEEER